MVNRILFTKFHDWRCEDEVRLSVRLDKDDETDDGLQSIDWGDTLRLVEVVVGVNSPTCKRELEQALVGYEHPVVFIKSAVSSVRFEMTASPDAVRNHDDQTYYIRRGRILHPTEFLREPIPNNEDSSEGLAEEGQRTGVKAGVRSPCGFANSVSAPRSFHCSCPRTSTSALSKAVVHVDMLIPDPRMRRFRIDEWEVLRACGAEKNVDPS
jgi:hypothetical protein